MIAENTITFGYAVLECANYVFDSDCEQTSYQQFIEDGNDPRDHILYHAAIVLNKASEFQTDIDEYLKNDEAAV